MAIDLRDHFRAFELLDDDEPMRGFRRVVRCVLRDWEKIFDHEGFSFEKPFDVRFAKAMVKTLSHVVGTDEEIVYGFAEHGEFSLLLSGAEEGDETSRQMLCRLASNAAGKMSLLLGDLALFDVHLYQFPSPELAKTYFVWRQRSHRDFSLDRHVMHVLTSNGQDPEAATAMIVDFGEDEKVEILSQHEVAFEEVPIWQRRGAGCYWQAGVDDEPPGLTVDTTLPIGDRYGAYLKKFL